MQTPGTESSKVADSRSVELSELLILVAHKDRVALQRLYRKTSAHLFGVLLRILGNKASAEDALQETYLKIWNKAGSYNEPSGRPITWMTSIARYHALDTLRSEKASRNRDSLYAVENEAEALVDIDIGANDVLNKCLHREDPAISQLLMQAYCEGYTHEELSHKAGKPLGTVKSWIRRALLSLKECINELS